MKSEDITRQEILDAIEGDGRFFVVHAKLRKAKNDPELHYRLVDLALQRERRAGVIESVARRWRAVEGRGDG